MPSHRRRGRAVPAAIPGIPRQGSPRPWRRRPRQERLRRRVGRGQASACGRSAAAARTSILATACHSMSAIIGLAEARCIRPYISRKPGTSAIGPKNGIGQCAFAPMIFDLLADHAAAWSGGDTPGIVGQLRGEPRHRSVQNQRPDPFRIGRREENAHRTALGHAEERRALRPGRVHHRVQVVHALIERRNTW